MAQRRAMRRTAPSALRALWHEIRRDVSILALANVAVVVLQLVFRGMLLLELTPSRYGRLALVLAIYNTVWLLGASGLPNTIAARIASGSAPADAQIRSAGMRAALVPTLLACAVSALAAARLLGAQSALPALLGTASLVYALVCMGVLRGRRRMLAAAAVMPLTGLVEVMALGALVLATANVTVGAAFACFCAGNVVGLALAALLVRRTSPRAGTDPAPAVRAWPMLAQAVWLALATAGLTLLPLLVRAVGAADSYRTVALLDIALILFSLCQRLAAVIVFAVAPHVAAARSAGRPEVRISLRDTAVISVPFVLASALLAFSPLAGWTFGALGRPAYAAAGPYLALALLAGPARVLYGVSEGVLIARGDGRFLGLSATAAALPAGALIVLAGLAGSQTGAFAVFALAVWAIYVVSALRLRGAGSADPASMPDLRIASE